MGRLGSSESESGAGACEGDSGGGSCARWGSRDGAVVPLLASVVVPTGVGAGIGVASGSALGGSGTGTSSVVECFPVVQGGIDRNSSKVRTRGLQHFQPERASILVRV